MSHDIAGEYVALMGLLRRSNPILPTFREYEPGVEVAYLPRANSGLEIRGTIVSVVPATEHIPWHLRVRVPGKRHIQHVFATQLPRMETVRATP